MTRSLLVVDDDAAVRRGLRDLFDSLGFRVVEAATAAEATRALRGGTFGVVLLDLSLGGPHGREGFGVLSDARAHGCAASIVIFTAFGSEAARAEAVARGAVDLWNKNLPIEDLVDRVLALAGRSGASAAPRA